MPLPQRPAARGGERGAAGRSVLGIVADSIRERAQLQQVVVVAETAAGEVEDLAAAPGEDVAPALRAAAVETLRGSKRFVRRVAGEHLVAAERRGDHAVAAAGSAPEVEVDREPAEAALAELASIALRVVAELEEPAPEPAPTPAARYAARLGEAVAFLEKPPILAESRARLERALDQPHAAIGDAVRVIETDCGLATAVLAAANRVARRRRGGVASVPAAIDVLGPRGVLRVAGELPTLRPLAGVDVLAGALVRISAHSVATRSAAAAIGRAVGTTRRDELRLAAAVHDVGKLALVAGGGEYARVLGDGTLTPEERLADERRRVTLDHAAIGAVLLRRLGLPKSVASTVERHHDGDAGGLAAIVRLADMLAHEAYGDAVAPAVLAAAARRVELAPEELERIAYELPRPRAPREAASEPSPLSSMQEKVLHGLAQGKTYKQIAADLSVSESTVRTHLHNLYRKVGVADRAQAVLLAVERGWL